MSKGPSGAAMAMMNEYCKLAVKRIPVAIRKVGTQEEKP